METVINNKKIFRFIVLTLIVLTCINIYTTYQTKLSEEALLIDLKTIATKDYLESNLNNAIEHKNYDDIQTFYNLSHLLNIDLDTKTIEKIEDENDFMNKSWENTKKFSKSFITGESDSAAGLAGSITSDMLVIGDIRDIKTETTKYLNNEDYDKLTLGFATIGLALSASEVVSAGTVTPIKVGTSLIKIAKKAGKISKPFLNIIHSKIIKSVDFSVLKKIDYSSISNLKKSTMAFKNSIKIDKLQDFFGKINKIKKNTSSLDTVNIIKYVDSEKDLNKVVKISDRFRENTNGIFKVLGKGALKAGNFVIEFTTLLIFQLIMLFFSVLGFIFSFFSQIYFLKRLLFSR